jgi:hypothetical protein
MFETRPYLTSIGSAIRFMGTIINKGTETIESPVMQLSDCARAGWPWTFSSSEEKGVHKQAAHNSWRTDALRTVRLPSFCCCLL